MKWNQHELGWQPGFTPRLPSYHVSLGNMPKRGGQEETQTDTRRVLGLVNDALSVNEILLECRHCPFTQSAHEGKAG